MVPDFTLNALNPVTCVLSAIVLLIQSTQCVSLLLLLTLVSLPCDVKFSSFQTDETVFPSVGIRARVTSVAFSFRYRRLFTGFLVILGVRRTSWTDNDDADDMLSDCLKSCVLILLLVVLDRNGWCLFYWSIWDIAWSKCCLWDDILIVRIDSWRSETRENVATGIHACVNNFGNWSFPNGLPGCCLRQLSTASFQYDCRGLKELLSSGCSLWLQSTGRHNNWIPKSSATSSTDCPSGCNVHQE
jgi:hypothetical protein